MILSYPLSYLYPQFKIWTSFHIFPFMSFPPSGLKQTQHGLLSSWLDWLNGEGALCPFVFSHLGGWLFYWENHIHFHSNALITYVLILWVSLVCFYWLLRTVLFCLCCCSEYYIFYFGWYLWQFQCYEYFNTYISYSQAVWGRYVYLSFFFSDHCIKQIDSRLPWVC